MLDIQHQVESDTKRQLRTLLKEQKRRRGMKDLHFFCKNILGYPDITPEDEFHGEYCRHLQNEKYKFKLSLTPRGTLKTSVGTVGGSLQDIVKNPNVRILLASEKFTIATAILSEIKGHIEKNVEFRDLYGDLVGDTWSKSEIIVKSRTTWKASPTIACGGVDVTKVGMHYDIIRVEDPHSDQNTGTQDQIDKVIRFYKLLLSLLDPGGYMYVTGTIWHYNDLYNYIITKERERVELGRKKRFKIFKRDSFEGTNDDLLNDRVTPDKLLWKERLSAEFLKDQLLEQGPYIFSCQYRLNPIDDDTAVFKRSWIKTCDFSEIPKRLRLFSAVDPMQDAEGKDFLAIATVGMDEYWRCYILDVYRAKADEHDTVDALFAIYNKLHPEKIGVETIAWQETFYKYVVMLQIQRHMKLPMAKIKNSTRVTKVMRIKSMVPYWKSGLFIVPCKDGDLRNVTGNMATLIDELTRYPKVANDDCVDALSMINTLTNRPGVVHILTRIPVGSFKHIRDKAIKGKKRHGKIGALNVRVARHAKD